jgi:adenylate cyclase
MAIEIERRYLVVNDSWIGKAAGIVYRQGYLYFQEDGVVRIRIAGDEAFLTVKVRKDDFNTLEYEYEIPIEDAEDMLERLCDRPPVEKKRYRISHAGMVWEVDEFSGDNEGLLIAEIELEYEKQMFDIPSWVGREVTGEKKYLNAYLYRNPYKNWPSKEKRRQK